MTLSFVTLEIVFEFSVLLTWGLLYYYTIGLRYISHLEQSLAHSKCLMFPIYRSHMNRVLHVTQNDMLIVLFNEPAYPSLYTRQYHGIKWRPQIFKERFWKIRKRFCHQIPSPCHKWTPLLILQYFHGIK